MTNYQHHRFIRNQFGIVSIIVTMVMMIVITMIVLTYSQIIRREQRQTLDRQLSSQAFYAAESAVNAVNAAIDAGAVTPASIPTGNCRATLSYLQTNAPTYYSAIPSSSNQAVTCLTVDPSSSTIAYSSIPADSSQVSHIQSATTVNQIEIAWQDDQGTSPMTFPSGKLESLSNWNSTLPLLRVDLVPTPASLTADSLYLAEQAYFLYPTSGGIGTTASLSGDTRGAIIFAKCNSNNTNKFCRATIVGLNGKDFYLRIRPVYKNADVIITPQDNTGVNVALTGGQVVIDATGRSIDVLKRISVRRPATPSNFTPGFAVDTTMPICKKTLVSASNTSDSCGLN